MPGAQPRSRSQANVDRNPTGKPEGHCERAGQPQHLGRGPRRMQASGSAALQAPENRPAHATERRPPGSGRRRSAFASTTTMWSAIGLDSQPSSSQRVFERPSSTTVLSRF